MILTIDIGNTHIAAALFDKQKLTAHWRLSSNWDRTEDEIWSTMCSISSSHGYDLEGIIGVAISSVVPDLTRVFERMVEKYLGQEPVVVSSKLDLGLTIKYENPASVGADRICNAVGGYARFGGPLIIVDFGTATTFDVISRQGDYLGGIIAPGIEMSSRILHQRAAKLPRVYLGFPQSVIGSSTETSMQSGLMYGSVHMINGLTQQIEAELGETAVHVATGGLADVLSDQFATPYKIEPHLTLEGLRLIYYRINNR